MTAEQNPQGDRELIRQDENLYRLLVESVKDYAIFMLDPQGRIVTWNIGAERIKGYQAADIIGQHFSRFYPKEVVERGWPEYELSVAAAEGRFEDEGWRVRKDGSHFWANVVITALRDASGTLVGFAKVTRDLTTRRGTEELARQLAAMEAARAEAEAATRRKDQLLLMLAHELRNPLAPLLTSLQVLRQIDASAAARAESLDRMERQLRHLGRIVDDLLDAARIDRGQISLQSQRLDLARLARQTTEDRRPLLEAEGLTLTVQAPETPLWVQGDATRLGQVVANLLDNARKFTDRGGRVEVRLAEDAPRRQAMLTVADSGIGIEAELLPRIFEPLLQGDHSLARQRGGLGLGLAVVKGLVELHGGSVEVVSAGPGHGATFTVRLPREPEPAALSASPPSPPVGRPLRLLVIEDSRDAADSLRLLLELQGHHVRVAYSGLEGVRLAQEWQPDTVISDIGLPELDGFGVATELRNNPATAGTRLVALTGYGGEDERQRGRRAGFDAYLVKPADPADLQRALTPNLI